MDSIDQLIDILRSELRSGFGVLAEKLDQTNSRLDQTNVQLVLTNDRLDLLESSVGQKLDGIGVYLKSINGTIRNHADELFDLKSRVDELERHEDPPPS